MVWKKYPLLFWATGIFIRRKYFGEDLLFTFVLARADLDTLSDFDIYYNFIAITTITSYKVVLIVFCHNGL